MFFKTEALKFLRSSQEDSYFETFFRKVVYTDLCINRLYIIS